MRRRPLTQMVLQGASCHTHCERKLSTQQYMLVYGVPPQRLPGLLPRLDVRATLCTKMLVDIRRSSKTRTSARSNSRSEWLKAPLHPRAARSVVWRGQLLGKLPFPCLSWERSSEVFWVLVLAVCMRTALRGAPFVSLEVKLGEVMIWCAALSTSLQTMPTVQLLLQAALPQQLLRLLLLRPPLQHQLAFSWTRRNSCCNRCSLCCEICVVVNSSASHTKAIWCAQASSIAS
mmetsp:Transcript_159104/g.280893  ORF Transcript_159104/g.280893 Transcript_159104/m.280893 type:complete len:232 (-) Transcript_159104:11-706(-)